MAPPDESRPRRLPTLSWDSVVEADAAEPSKVADEPAAPDEPAARPPVVDSPTSPTESIGFQPMVIEPVTLGSLPGSSDGGTPIQATPASEPPPAPAAPPAAPVPPTTPAAPVATPSPTIAPADAPAVDTPVAPVVAPDAAPVPHAEPSDPAATPAASEGPVAVDSVVRTRPPQPIVAPVAEPEVISGELPQIREATPVDPVAEAVPEYRLPTIPQPDQTRSAPVPAASAYAMETSALPVTQRRAKKSRGGVKLFLVLLVLGGLVAAGIVFGQPYLFPEDWDPAAEPYAMTVETVRGVEYPESLLLTAEPTVDYTARMTDQLTGDWTAQLPEWRALGLLTGEANEANVRTLLDGWQDAIHDQTDGQVYHDDAASGPQLDAEITQAFTSVLLDQQYGWTAQQSERTLDDAAFTLAEVGRQSIATQAESAYPAAVDARATAPLSFLPPVLAYRVLAPATFAEFDRPDIPDDAENPLRGIGAAGPGPLAGETPVLSSPAAPLDGDTIAGAPAAMDRSFWYLVLAGYLDTRTAYNASEAIVENSLTMAERVANRCVYATFSGGDVEQTATLRGALEAWSAAVPLEMSSSFTVQGDGTLQLTTCDPGSRFDNGSRIGVGRELIGWRMAELATTVAVTANGGDADDVAAAWAAVEATNVPVDLANLPFDTTPAAAAATAEAAVTAVLPSAGS